MHLHTPSQCKPRFIGIWTLAVLLLVFAPSLVQAQTDTTLVTITGMVVERLSRRPLEGVVVTVAELDREVQSDARGQFLLSDLPLGTYEIGLEREGYRATSGPLQVLRPGSFTVTMSPLGEAARGESGRLAGRVFAQEDGDPLEGVEVTLQGVGLSNLTDERGRFVFRVVSPGQHTLVFDRLGYSQRVESVSVEPDQIMTVEVRMGIEPIEMEPIAVTVEAKSLPLDMAGFYDRRDATSGIFISREQIEERLPVQTTDLFWGLPGVRVSGSGFEKSVTLRGGLQVSPAQNRCGPAVYLDGIRVEQGGRGGNLDRLIDPSEIAGIEIYTGIANVPLQYSAPGSRCGVIVLWTR